MSSPDCRLTGPKGIKTIDRKGITAGTGHTYATRKLRKLPRDAGPTRLRNRDTVDGRPRALFRAFSLSRIRLREMAHRGELPGVTKSSW